MGVDLGLDGSVEAVENAPDAGSFVDRLLSLFTAGLKSDRTPFGAAAKIATVPVSVPVGVIVKWCGSNSSIPAGWLACEGQAVSRTTYAALFAKIGTTFGGGAGTTFNLPDYRRRVSVGAGGSRPTGSAGPGTAIGDTGGAETVTLTAEQMAQHSHSLNLQLNAPDPAQHRHTTAMAVDVSDNPSSNDLTGIFRTWASVGATSETLDAAGEHTHLVSGNTASAGAAAAVALASKVVVMTHIIKT